MAFSIDQHSLRVLEADGVDVEPRMAQRLVVGVAQVCAYRSSACSHTIAICHLSDIVLSLALTRKYPLTG